MDKQGTDEQQGVPVVVTTEHRGVFFGYLKGARDTVTAELTDAQMCVYWANSIHGVLGLAATGPDSKCRVTPPVPSITLHKITAIAVAADEAVKAWQTMPWSRS